MLAAERQWLRNGCRVTLHEQHDWCNTWQTHAVHVIRVSMHDHDTHTHTQSTQSTHTQHTHTHIHVCLDRLIMSILTRISLFALFVPVCMAQVSCWARVICTCHRVSWSMSYHVMLCHIMSYHVMSWHVMAIMSSHLMYTFCVIPYIHISNNVMLMHMSYVILTSTHGFLPFGLYTTDTYTCA